MDHGGSRTASCPTNKPGNPHAQRRFAVVRICPLAHTDRRCHMRIMTEVTIFYDGACPLCLREIAFLRKLDRRDRLAFENVADPNAPISCPIDRETLLARFHARLPNGEVVDGARAFTEAYARVPGLSFMGTLGRFGPTRAALNGLYGLFLKVRPRLQWLARRANL